MAESMAWNLACVSASSASGSLSATMPPPATRRAVWRSSDSSAQRIATAHVPLPEASTQPTAPPYGPRSNPSTDVDQLERRVTRVAADGRRRRQRPHQLEHRSAPGSTSGPRRSNRGAARWPPSRSTAPAPSRDSCTTAAACRAPSRSRCGARPGSWCWRCSSAASRASLLGVAGDRRRPGERVRPDHVALDRHQQLGRRADEPVDREAIARTEAGPQPSEHGVDVDRVVGLTVIGRAITALTMSPDADRVAGRLDRAQVVGDVDGGSDLVRRRGRDRPAIGRSARSASSIRVTHARAVGTSCARRRSGSRARPASRAGTAARRSRSARRAPPTVVVVLDRREHSGGIVVRHAGRDAAAGETDAVAHEQEAVTTGHVVEVERHLRAVG